ncbi:Nucleotidyltransferase family protein [Burkholderiales bacterium]|nr:Nucleotidyltransferase family protein [Burkholderiales bacterium]
MHALILAAGRGERMRPLTDTVAKPLLPAAGRRLIEWQIEALVRAGILDLVVNTAHLAEQIEAALGDGSRYGARIGYSREGTTAADALETLGGIVKALVQLGPQPFLAVSSDILTDFDYRQLLPAAAAIERGQFDAHLVLVENPPYHPLGDMGIAARPGGDVATCTGPRYTYANIGVLAPRLFRELAPVRAPLFPWLFEAVERGRVSTQLWRGRWCNVGTPQDLAIVDRIWR